MIITVTMNPAIDKTAAVHTLCPRALNRLSGVLKDVGGKGINVSRTIAALGGRSVATGFLAGDSGRSIERVLQETEGVTPDFLYIEGETRTNLKLVEPDGSLTELNEQGPSPSNGDLERLMEKLNSHAGPDTLFVLAGSAGPEMAPDIYGRMIEALHTRGARVFLDADGPLFAGGLKARPDIIKPNEFELCQLFGRSHAAEEELIEMGRRLNGQGIGLVCISRGADGALFVQGEQVYRAPGLAVKARSSVGAGDAMVAAIAYGLDGRLPLQDCLRLGLASSAAACTTQGTRPPSGELVRELEKQVRITAG